MARDLDSSRISSQLILDVLNGHRFQRGLVLTAVAPQLIQALSKKVDELDVFDLSYTALSSLPHETNVNVSFQVFPEHKPRYDFAVIIMPKGRLLARGLMWSAAQALQPRGALYLAGPSSGGMKSLHKDAGELFESTTVETYKQGHRVIKAVRPYGVYPWGSDPTQIRVISLTVPQRELMVATMPGVFSWQGLDAGTAFLLHSVDMAGLTRDKRVLDMGCGNGIVGAVATVNANHVTLVDENLLAVKCAQKTMLLNEIANAEVIASDVYRHLESHQFDTILTNPPFHEKFQVDQNVAHRIIRGAKKFLTSSGCLVWVANAFLNYEAFAAEYFEHVDVIAHDARYKVVRASKPHE